MFFILSKVLAFLLQPVNWIIFLLLVGYFSKKDLRKRRAYRSAVALFLIFTNPLLLHLGISTWEVPPTRHIDIPDHMSCGIVLGGYYKQASIGPKDRFQLNERPNRLINALELLEAKKVDQLILSGGNGSLGKRAMAESILVDSLLDPWCWPDSLTIPETRSRNTYENILYSKEIIDELHLSEPVLLITSAFHMRRALAICKKQGLEVIPYTTDPITEPLSWLPNKWLLPDAKGFQVWNILFKEWVGIVVYKLKGYT